MSVGAFALGSALGSGGSPSYSQQTPANARVQGLGAIFTPFRLDRPRRIPENVRGRPGGPTLPRGRRTKSQGDGPLVSSLRPRPPQGPRPSRPSRSKPIGRMPMPPLTQTPTQVSALAFPLPFTATRASDTAVRIPDGSAGRCSSKSCLGRRSLGSDVGSAPEFPPAPADLRPPP
jgi:hypothetical protein